MLFRRFAPAALLALLLHSPAVAGVADLSAALRLGDIVDVMREEGLAYADTMRADMFPDAAAAPWLARVDAVYDADRITAAFDVALAEKLADATDIDAMTGFFTSDLGQKIVTLEIDARRALIDEGVQETARDTWDAQQAKGGARVDLIASYVQVNDMVERNVMGTLNSNLEFYRGMAAAGGQMAQMGESDMLAEVWAQEEQIRTEAEDWVFPFLAMAYAPLTDAELQAYVDFCKSAAGQRLNAALFDAFDVVFADISRQLGLAAGQQMQGQDI